MSNEIITIGMADDHQMIRQSIKSLIDGNGKYKVIMEAFNGIELIEKLKTATEVPRIFLIDISMPEMDGYQTITYLTKNYPNLKCIALSVNTDFNSVFKMIDSGASAYLRKDCSTEQMLETIDHVFTEGTYYNSFVVNSLLDYQHALIEINSEDNTVNQSLIDKLTPRESEFILLACSELTYKAIGGKMGVSARTVDSFREAVFSKLNIKSRTGLLLFAIRNKIYIP
jgi:DNA-binding NarL/FixJ family response regulator